MPIEDCNIWAPLYIMDPTRKLTLTHVSIQQEPVKGMTKGLNIAPNKVKI